MGEAARRARGLRLLLLHGSRARDDHSVHSDWDFGYLGDGDVDADGLLAALVTALGTDKIDLVDLERAGGLLRYRAARDGRILFESTDGVADRFVWDAVSFWCDAGPVLHTGYDDVLARLPQ